MALVHNKRNWWQVQDDTGDWRRRARWWTPERFWVLLEGIKAGRSDAWIAKELGTTETAVMLARKRARLPSRTEATLNTRKVAQMLGIGCSKSVARWIEQGWLVAHRGQARGGNQQWVIRPSSLYRFLENPDHWHRWDAFRISDPFLRKWAESLPRDTYLTTGEVAERMFVEHRAVRRWVAIGELPAIKHGYNWLIPESALIDFVPLHQRDRRGYTQHRFNPDEDRVLLTRRVEGASWSQIANELNRPVNSVHGRWHRIQKQEAAP